MAWVFERISRHPDVLRRLEGEVAAGETDEYRLATILEVQRIRTIIDFAGRHVYAPTFQLGEWVIPRGFSVIVAIDHMHEDAKEFADPERFDPARFLGRRPPLAFLPFGGGTRRCVGAVFAQVEMDVVLRTVLRHLAIQVTSAPGEKVFSRGVAYTPKDGGRVTLRRRVTPL
jgi:cytochrome P450